VNPVRADLRGLIGLVSELLSLQEGPEEGGPGYIAWIHIFDVGDNSDDFIVGGVRRVAQAKMFVSGRQGSGVGGDAAIYRHQIDGRLLPRLFRSLHLESLTAGQVSRF
jgi:hypothetical protein